MVHLRLISPQISWTSPHTLRSGSVFKLVPASVGVCGRALNSEHTQSSQSAAAADGRRETSLTQTKNRTAAVVRAGDHGEGRGDHGGGRRGRRRESRVHGHAWSRGGGHGGLLPLPFAAPLLPLLRRRLYHHQRLVPASSGGAVPPHPQLRRPARAAVPRRGLLWRFPVLRRQRRRSRGAGGRPAEVQPDHRVLLLHLLHVVLAHGHRRLGRLHAQAATRQEEGIERQRSEEGCTCRRGRKQEAQGEEGAAGGEDPGAAAACLSVRQDRHGLRPARGARLHTLPARPGPGPELAVHAQPATFCAPAHPGATASAAERPPEPGAVPGAGGLHRPRRRRRQRRGRLVVGGTAGRGGGRRQAGCGDASCGSSSPATGLAG